MKKYILCSILMLMILCIFSGCNQLIAPETNDKLDYYVYSQLKNKHSIKLYAEDIFMISQNKYLAKISVNNNTNNIATYNLIINGDMDETPNISYDMKEPYVTYIKNEKKPYIIVTNNNKTIEGNGFNYIHQYEVQIFVPEHQLNSIPNDKGKFGVDCNKKIN